MCVGLRTGQRRGSRCPVWRGFSNTLVVVVVAKKIESLPEFLGNPQTSYLKRFVRRRNVNYYHQKTRQF